jgi:hypothetical protein
MNPLDMANIDPAMMEAACCQRAQVNQWVLPSDFPQTTDTDNPNMNSLSPAYALGGPMNEQMLDSPMPMSAPQNGEQLGVPQGASGVSPFAGDPKAMGELLRARMQKFGSDSRMAQDRAVSDNRQALLTGNKLGF